MKDFDEQRREWLEERRKLGNTFVIGGETFAFRVVVRPDHFFAYDNLVGRTVPMGELLELIDNVIVDLLEGEDAASRWAALRERRDDPITLADMNELMSWLIEQVTGRPPSQPESSQAGLGESGTPSTETSSDEQAAA